MLHYECMVERDDVAFEFSPLRLELLLGCQASESQCVYA